MLPALSPELSGRLALFHYGENLKHVPFFRSEDSRELLRFQSLVSIDLKMRAFSQEEDILVDSLHLLCEGLVGMTGRVFHKGTSFGYHQCLDQRAPPTQAFSLTFVMCMTLEAEAMWDILRTGQFPSIRRQARIHHGFLALKMALKKMADEHKQREPENWKREDMVKYKEFLLKVSADPSAEHDNPCFGQEVSSGFISDFAALSGSLDDDYEKANVKTMLRLILKKMAIDVDGDEGDEGGESGAGDDGSAPAPAAAAGKSFGGAPGVDAKQLSKLQNDIAMMARQMAANKTDMKTQKAETDLQLRKVQGSLNEILGLMRSNGGAAPSV
jgi:hypothetical protein